MVKLFKNMTDYPESLINELVIKVKQYPRFSKAEIEKLRDIGYVKEFNTLKNGVIKYTDICKIIKKVGSLNLYSSLNSIKDITKYYEDLRKKLARSISCIIKSVTTLTSFARVLNCASLIATICFILKSFNRFSRICVMGWIHGLKRSR